MLPVWITDSVTPDLARAIHYTLLWGFEGVVLRSVGKNGQRVPHINEFQLQERLSENDLPIAAIDPGLFEGAIANKAGWMNEVLLLEEVCAFSRRVGSPLILVGGFERDNSEVDVESLSEPYQMAGDVVARYGLTIAIRNEQGSAVATGESLAALLAHVGHSSVKAAWSPFGVLAEGENPSVGLEKLVDADNVGFVYVRDGRKTEAIWESAIPGEGEVDWQHQLQLLASSGYDGPVCLDIRGDNPAKEGLGQADALIRLIRSAKRSASPV